MKKLLLTILLILGPFANADVSDERLLDLIGYITEVSSLKYENQELPSVAPMSGELLKIYAYGDFKVAQAEFKGETLAEVSAIYLSDKNRIYVNDELDLAKQESTPSLVHELVHFLQKVNGITDSVGTYEECLEGEAYDIQATWQYEHKVMLESVPTYEQILYAYMQCSRQF